MSLELRFGFVYGGLIAALLLEMVLTVRDIYPIHSGIHWYTHCCVVHFPLFWNTALSSLQV